jgi:hypothetical protein
MSLAGEVAQLLICPESGQVRPTTCMDGNGVNQGLETRLGQASIEMPKKYHHIVPLMAGTDYWTSSTFVPNPAYK